MEWISFLTGTLSFLTLLTISSFTYLLAKKINFPYTVLLVLIGIILVPLSRTEYLWFIDDFKLTPDVLFFVFLPVLLFESAYNINYKHLLKNWKVISSLSVIWLIISTVIISLLMYYILPFLGLQIPFLVCLLFASLISATDPVAVLSIFKSMWAPRRLALIFEWESLFNDWTALALFLVILWIIIEWNWLLSSGMIYGWIWAFLSMVLWGIIFGVITWVLFSKIIGWIKNNESVEITLTMVLAHLTFILAELITHQVHIFGFDLKISWVISTVVAGIIIWNYGRYKISPKVEEYMEKFWGFFAFISNSIVFILMGLILSSIKIDFWIFVFPILVVIVIVMIARAISVYLPVWILNITKLEEKVPITRQHLMSWWSLRGALALMMVLMIPAPGDDGYEMLIRFQETIWWNYDFSIRDFILVMTIGSIMFTLFIKATTISWFMKLMWVDKLHELEQFEYEEGKILAYLKIIEKLNNSFKKSYMTKDEYDELKDKYETKLKESVSCLREILRGQHQNAEKLVRRALSLHALGIEKQHLKNLFYYNEIWDVNFRFILNKITRQIERLEQWDPQIREDWWIVDKNDYDIFEKILLLMRKNKIEWIIDRYIRNRARVIITRKVIKELKGLKSINFGFDSCIFDEIIDLYERFNAVAIDKKEILFAKHKTIIIGIETKLVDKSLLKLEEQVIKDLFAKEIITTKIYLKFMEEIEEEIYADVKKLY